MSKTKIVLNRAGVKQLLQCDPMLAYCDNLGQNALNKLGEGYETKTFIGFDRVHTIVRADSKEARKENLEDNTILKAVTG